MYSPCFNYLPDTLCFDEFKATKDCDGYMSFIFCDAKNGKIIDILSDRRLHKLKEYFNSKITLMLKINIKVIMKIYFIFLPTLFDKEPIYTFIINNKNGTVYNCTVNTLIY